MRVLGDGSVWEIERGGEREGQPGTHRNNPTPFVRTKVNKGNDTLIPDGKKRRGGKALPRGREKEGSITF